MLIRDWERFIKCFDFKLWPRNIIPGAAIGPLAAGLRPLLYVFIEHQNNPSDHNAGAPNLTGSGLEGFTANITFLKKLHLAKDVIYPLHRLRIAVATGLAVAVTPEDG